MDSGTCVVGGPAFVFQSDIDGYADFAEEVIAGVASPAVLAGAVAAEVALLAVAGEVAVLTASPAVAGTASPDDFARVDTVGVASLADAGAASRPMLGWRPRPTLLGLLP